MEININRLTECILMENQVVTDLIDLGNTKRQVVILGDITELTEIMRRESQLLKNLEKAETQRQAESLALASLVGLKEEELTASSLIDQLKGSRLSDAIRLSEEIDNLAHNLNQLKDINQHNTVLLNQSLAFVESMEAFLTHQRETTYSEGGSVKSSPARSVLDKTI